MSTTKKTKTRNKTTKKKKSDKASVSPAFETSTKSFSMRQVENGWIVEFYGPNGAKTFVEKTMADAEKRLSSLIKQ